MLELKSQRALGYGYTFLPRAKNFQTSVGSVCLSANPFDDTLKEVNTGPRTSHDRVVL